MLAFQLTMLAFGTILIRLFHVIRRRLTGQDQYFSFSDFLIEESHVQVRGFLYMALPPFIAGFLLALLPMIEPLTVVGSGFLAAFLGVWPVFQFPYHLLDKHLLSYWEKLKFLYVIFMGFSAALAYLGFLASRQLLPVLVDIAGTSSWQSFLDDLAANALYDLLKAAVLGLLILGGLFVSNERKRIGGEIEAKKEQEWKQRMNS